MVDKMKFLSAFLWAIAIALVVSLIKKLTITDKKKNNLIKKGMEKGQTVKAKLISQKQVRRNNPSAPDDSTMDNYFDRGVYQYEFNGRTYKEVVYERVGYLKKEMEIVHTRNLGRLYRSTKVYWLEYFVISLAIMLIIMYA